MEGVVEGVNGKKKHKGIICNNFNNKGKFLKENFKKWVDTEMSQFFPFNIVFLGVELTQSLILSI